MYVARTVLLITVLKYAALPYLPARRAEKLFVSCNAHSNKMHVGNRSASACRSVCLTVFFHSSESFSEGIRLGIIMSSLHIQPVCFQLVHPPGRSPPGMGTSVANLFFVVTVSWFGIVQPLTASIYTDEWSNLQFQCFCNNKSCWWPCIYSTVTPQAGWQYLTPMKYLTLNFGWGASESLGMFRSVV